MRIKQSRVWYMVWVVIVAFLFAIALSGCSDSDAADPAYTIIVEQAPDGATCYVLWSIHAGASGISCK